MKDGLYTLEIRGSPSRSDTGKQDPSSSHLCKARTMSGTDEDQIEALRTEVGSRGARPAKIYSIVSKTMAVKHDRSAGDLVATLSGYDRAPQVDV